MKEMLFVFWLIKTSLKFVHEGPINWQQPSIGLDIGVK